MPAIEPAMSYKRAREILGVTLLADETEIRRAYHAAAKRAHPDRPGGDASAFREVAEAYARLRLRTSADAPFHAPSPMRPTTSAGRPELVISPQVAFAGGPVEHVGAEGRILRVTLPPGMRPGDVIRAAGVEMVIRVKPEAGVMVRGGDIWITAEVDPVILAKGGRIAVDTPIGRRIVWVTGKAGERGLIRLPGQGLPARGRHREGCLFLRLGPLVTTPESPARVMLRQFAAAWAA